MKKNKIIGLLVAVGGTAVSIATASALAATTQDPLKFNIGAQYSTVSGSITYKINGAASGTVDASYLKADGTNGGVGLGGEYTQVEYNFALSAVYSTMAQDYVVGNFKIELTNINEAMVNNSVIWAEVENYTKNTYGASEYAHVFMNSDTAIDDDEISIDKDFTVACSGTQNVRVLIKLNSALTGDALMELAEAKPFDISVTWGAPSTYVQAQVEGDKNAWKTDEAYNMVPNIEKEGTSLEWYFKGLTGFTEGKARKGDDWSADPNATLDASKTYNVYWDGNTANAANFAEQAA